MSDEIRSSATAVQFDRVLELVALETKTTMGRKLILDRRPHTSLEACTRAQSELWEMVRYYLAEGMLPFHGLSDAEAALEGEDLELASTWQIVRSVRAIEAIREALRRAADFPRLRATADDIDDFSALLTKVGRYFHPDGTLREEASAELRAIRSKMHAKRSQIQRSLSELLTRNQDAVQDQIITLRGDRYCVPVKAERRSEVPGILHERSGSGASFFVEPIGVVEMNNDLADLLIQEREEIARITRFIANELRQSAAEIRRSSGIAAHLDAVQASAIFAERIDASKPQFTEERRLRLVDARHPLLDERIAGLRQEIFAETESDRRVIPTTIELSPEQPALLISGPNAGGKTVALKTAGLLTLMAASGLPLPAKEPSIVPVIDRFHVLIGDDQDVLAHLSTFSAYLTRLKRVLESTTSRSFVLLDELGSGTDPEDAGALAASVLDHLLETGCLMIVTTHLAALKTHALRDERIQNASMEFDAATGGPTFHLIVGVPGRSRAIDAAAAVGLPRSIIESARERLGNRYGEVDQIVADLQENLAAAKHLRLELEAGRDKIAAERSTIEKLRAEIEEERRRVAREFKNEINRIRDDVQSRLGRELRSLKDLDREARAKVKSDEVMSAVVEPLTRVAETIVSAGEIRVGDEVEHRRFSLKGIVTKIDGERISFSVNGKRMQAARAELLLANPKKPAARNPERPASANELSATPPEAIVASAEINLIGHRVDEALDESDRFLDRSLLDGRAAVRLIHGHGSGALKRAVREHLRRHPAVRSFRPGGDQEGGDGATIALLDI
jgi:DNA mismatch repair protein MutS2